MRQKAYPLWAPLHAFRLMRLDLTQILLNAELDPALQYIDAITGGEDELYRLFAAAAQVDGKPDFGLRLAVAYTRVPCGVTYYGFHAAANFGAALKLLVKYKGDTSPNTLNSTSDGRYFSLHHAGPRPDMDSVGALLTFSWLVEMQRVTYRDPAKPVVVTLKAPVPDLPLYEQHLGCRIDLTNKNSIRYTHAALRATPLTSPTMQSFRNRVDARELVADTAEEGSSFAALVKACIQCNMSTGRIKVSDIAISLCTSPRTLQRRLADEGVSLKDLQDDVRREFALSLLQREAITFIDVAQRLGYGDVGTFFKAFKVWYGTTPAQYRQAHQARQAQQARHGHAERPAQFNTRRRAG